jgi:ABC-2 type transport system ATP-binding protein
MIEIVKVNKRFGRTAALSRVSLTIASGSVYGLLGANGAGKSTLMRMLSGVLKPDKGTVRIDGEKLFENTAQKQRCFSVSDEPYFFAGSTPREMMRYYAMLYPQFDTARCRALLSELHLEENVRLRTFSKGMRRQAYMALAVSAGTDYLFCDEGFDGLDPSARRTIKNILLSDVQTRGMTAVITSHNLQELDSLADSVGLLRSGALMFSRRVEDVRQTMQKIQYVSETPVEPNELFRGMPILRTEQHGRLRTVVLHGSRKQAEAQLRRVPMVYCESIPLTLEEIFLTEMEVKGYEPEEIGV